MGSFPPVGEEEEREGEIQVIERAPIVEIDEEQMRVEEEEEIRRFEDLRHQHEARIRRLRAGQASTRSEDSSLLTPPTQEPKGPETSSSQAIQEQMLAMMKLMASTQASLAAMQQQSATGVRASQTPGPFVPSSSSRLKLNPPQEFTGSKPEALRQFIMQCRLHFEYSGSLFPDEESKIGYMITYLRGSAQDAVRPMVESSIRPVELSSVDDFVEYLKSSFGDPDEKGTARRRLKGLCQTGSAAEYFAKFREIMSILGWTDPEPIVDRAVEGLSSELKDELARSNLEFLSLDSLVKFIVPLDNRIRVREDEKKVEQRKSQEIKPVARALISSNQQRGGVPYNSQVVASTSLPSNNLKPGPFLGNGPSRPITPRTGLSPEEKERRMKEGLCYRCGQKGHGSRDCPLQKFSPGMSAAAANATDPKA